MESLFAVLNKLFQSFRSAMYVFSGIDALWSKKAETEMQIMGVSVFANKDHK